MKTPLTRLALLVAATAVSVPAPDALAGVVDGRYDLQYYLDFCRNKGMFATGATNIEVFFKDGTSIANNTIPLMPNMDSYGQTVSSIIGNKIGSNGGTNLVSAQFVYGAKHVHAKVENSDVAFLAENGLANCIYDSANLDNFGTDSSMQRLTKLVTSVAYTPMADDAFMSTLKVNDTWFYRIGNGGTWCDGKSIPTGDNSLGGVVNLSVCWQDNSTGEWYLEGWARKNDITGDTLTPLDIGTYFGDSGSPFFTWDDANNRFVFVGAMFAGGCQLSFPNWYIPRYNYRQGSAVMEKYTVVADKFSGTEKIVWGTQDAALGTGTLTQGDVSVTYTGKGSGNTIADTLGLTFSTEDAENEQHLELAGSVNMGAGALTFESGKWKLSEADSAYTLASAGFEIKKGAELTLELTGTSSEEIRKVGEGTLTIAGSGNNESTLVVGGGTTVYNVVRDENGNITDCTIGNAGETRLNRDGGYAASSVRLEGGVAIIVLMQDNQFKTNTTAGDTFSFGNAGGLLNLNGHNLEWGVINQNGSGTGARIGNFTPLNEAKPENATFTYTGTGTFAGSFMDEGANGAQLAVVYNNATEGSTWTLTGNSSNYGGFAVEAGTMKLEGTRTPHVRTTDWNDWAYATVKTSRVEVQNGATFQLSHHALLEGNVVVEDGGNFVMNQTVNAASESISGSRRQNMAELGITSLKGNVTLNGTASMTVNTTSPVATTMKGNISGGNESAFTKTGSGLFVVDGQVAVTTGTVEAGGIVVKNKDGFTGEWTIQDAGYLGVEGMNGDAMLSHISADSTGVLALGADQTTAIADLGNYTNLYIGALGTVEYGTAGTADALSANTNKQWLLGGGTGTLNVNFLLTGENDLIIGNDYSSGTVHLTNTANDFTGDIYIKGTGNMLTYADGALGSARVALSYGNTLGLNDAGQLEILKEGAAGVLALTSSMNVDLSGKTLSVAAAGDLTFTGSVTVSDDTYRFGGKGNLTLDTELSSASKMELDGQGNTGSSVIFARENAFTGTITAGGGLYLDEVNSAGDIAIHVGNAEALSKAASVNLQKGATLHTDGKNIVVNNLSAQTGSFIQNKGDAASLLQLNVDEGASATVENGVLVDANNNATLSLVKTGAGTLTMGGNTSWSGGLTVMEGTVKGSIASGGIGAAGASVYVNKGATLQLTSGATNDCKQFGSTILQQKLSGNGEVSISNGNDMLFMTQAAGFEGQVKVTGNTRLYIAQDASIDSQTKYNTSQAFDKATIVVESGSQARLTSSIFSLSGTAVNSWANYVISGADFKGGSGGLVQSQHDGALVIDGLSTVWGNVTLADDAMIASWSANPTESQNFYENFPYYCGPQSSAEIGNKYGIINKLGGVIRGKILGEGKTLTFGGNEGMTITADSANTFGDLIIASGNGNNYADSFALRLNNGAAKSQTSTALGTGSVTLNDGLILRLAGTGTADNSHVVYTYENAISAGDNATLQSYNITNRLTGTVTMSDATLNLATANGGVLELAGGISGNGTLNVGANSKIVLGSASSAMAIARSGSAQFSGNVVTESGADITLMSNAVVSADTTFTGTDSLTLRFAGTEDYTLGGITLTGSEITNDDGTTGTTATALNLNFDFTSSVISSGNTDSYTTLSSEITADNTNVTVDLNIFEVLAAGTYTLISDFDGTYSLANNTTDNRLSLSISGSDLVLTVAEDTNRLLWSGESASHDWNTSDSNWLRAGTPTAFTENTDVIFSATGVDSGTNSANSRETITLNTAAQTAGTVNVLDAYYEIGGNYALTGTALNIGASGDLLLSTDAIFESITVQDGNLTVNGSTLAGALSAQDGASVIFEDNAALTGDITTNGAASVSVNQSSVTGTISLTGAAELNLDSATISGEVSFGSTGRIIAGTYDGTNVSPASTAISGQFTANSGSMTLSDGTVVLDGAVNLTNFTIADGKTATLWNATETIGQSKKIESLTLNNGASLEINNRISKTSDSAVIGTLTVDNSATIKEVYDAGHLRVSTLNMAEGQSSATLTLTKDSKNTSAAYTSVFDFGSATTEAGNFVGNVVLNNTNSSSTKHSAFINLYNAKIFANTVVTMGTQNSVDGYLGLGISTNGVQIAGLESQESYGNRALLFSGYAPTDIGWNTGDGPNKNNDEVARTLTINTTSGNSYTYYGQVREQLSLIKSGEGRQAFYGNSSDFNGSISVEAGTLAFNAAGSSMLSGASTLSVGGGAILDLSAITFGSGEDTTNTIALSSGAEFSFDADAVIAFDDMKTGVTYNVFDATNGTLSGWNTDNLDAGNFTINGIAASEFGHTVQVELGINGTINFNAEHYNLVWIGGESGTWNRETTNTPWKQAIGDSVSETTTYFANYDNVAFNGNASVEITEAVKVDAMTIADGASVSLTETGALTAESISVGNGATLTFAMEKAGYSAANISGAGTVVLDLTNNHGNQLKLGAEFTGETHLSNGYFTITDAQVGSKLTLGNGTEYQTTDTAGTTVTADIVLTGTTGVHANGGKAVIYSKSVTGDTYLSKGSSSHTFNGTVDLNVFNTEDIATVNFNAKTDIDTLTVDAVNNNNVGVKVNFANTTTVGTFSISNNTTTNFNGETAITTANVSDGTTSFNASADITTATFSNGTTNFNGNTALTTANFNGGTVNFATDSLSIGTFNRSSGNINFKLKSGAENTSYTVGNISGDNYGTLTVDSGVTLNAASITTPSGYFASASRGLTVNGEMNLSGAVDMRYTNGITWSGSGGLNIDGNVNFQLSQWGAANISVNELNIGGNLSLNSYWQANSVHQVNILSGETTVCGQILHTSTGYTGSDRVALNINGGSLIMKGGATMSQGTTTISSGKLEQAGGTSTISNTFTMSGGELVVSGGTMSITSAPTVTGGSVSVSGGTLVLTNDSATLLGASGGVTLSSGELDLSAVAFSSEGGIALGGAMSVTGGVIDLGNSLTAGTTYNIFDLTAENASLENWENLANNISVNGTMLSRYANATLSLTADAATLNLSGLDKSSVYWTGGSAGTWDYSSANWDLKARDANAENNVAFLTNDSVVFDTDAEIAVRESVSVGSLTVESGSVLTLTAETGTALTVNSALNVANDATLNLQGGSYTFAGDIGSAGNAGTVNFAGTDIEFGTAVHTIYGTFNVKNDTTLTSNRVGENYNDTGIVNISGSLNVEAGKTLTLDGNGRVVLAAGAEISLANESAMTRTANGAYWLRGKLSVKEGATANFTTPDDIHFNYDNAASSKASIVLEKNSNLTIQAKNFNIYDGATTSVSLAEGSCLTLSGFTLAGYTHQNVSGTGTLVLSLSGVNSDWNNKIDVGSNFSGEVHLNSGCMTLDGSVTGNKLVLLSDNADIQLTTSTSAATQWTGDLELRGTHDLHSNSNTDFTFTGDITGAGTYVKKSSGSLSFGSAGSVKLGGFEQSNGKTTFNGSAKLSTVSVSGGTVNFNGETSIGTANITGGSVSISGALVGSLTKEGAGTLTLSGDNSNANRLNVSAGTLIAGHTNALGTGAISVESGAVLQANAAITLSAESQVLTLVVGEAQVVSSTYNLRSTNATGTALITSGEGTNGKISVDGNAVVYVDVSALTETQSALSGDRISLQLATESALDFNDTNAKVGWWDESGTSWTDWSVANSYTYDSGSGLLTITIPEPSTFGLLAGLSALALCVSRRKRRK